MMFLKRRYCIWFIHMICTKSVGVHTQIPALLTTDELLTQNIMKIKNITATPLYLKLKNPYHWAQGVNYGAEVVFITIETDVGIVGYGECFGAPNCEMTVTAMMKMRDALLDMDVHQISKITNLSHRKLCASHGPGNHKRLSFQLTVGLEMALWDIVGKANNLPVHKLLGGAQREHIKYFGFAHGATPEEKAKDAKRLIEENYEVIYIKIGFDFEHDIQSVAAVRKAIGNKRLRVDANENWDILTARTMLRKLARYNIEMIEQPVDASSHASLSQLRNSSDIPIAADQSIHTVQDIFEVCKIEGADLIVLGLHECGGLLNFIRSAAVADAAGLNISIHGNLESGITTCASHQAALTVSNLDDGNQIMGAFLREDIVALPNLEPKDGKLMLNDKPGLGFELDFDAISRASEAYARKTSG